jgi:predicted MFS family arabinose efflux permease
VRLLARLVRLVWGPEVDRVLRPILAIGFVRSAAGGTVWTFVGIWAIERLGAGQTAVGAAYLTSALVGAGSGYVGGHLSDHLGRRPLILLSWTLQIPLVLGFLAAGGNEKLGLGLMCFGGLFWQLGSAADQAMVADLVPPARHEAAFAATRVTMNLGVSVGPPLGGALLALGSWRLLFAGAAVLSSAGLLIALRYLPRRGAYSPEEPPKRHSFGVISRDRVFLLFLVSSVLAYLVYVVFEVVLPISLVESHGLEPATWGFLVVVNPIMVALFQLRLTRRLEPISAGTKLAVGIPLMGLPFLALPVEDAVPVVALAILVFVVGEMLWVPTSQTLVARLAPEDLRGAYMGAFGTTAAIGFALGPFLGLQVRANLGDGALWVCVAAMSLLGAAVGLAACRVAVARRPQRARAAPGAVEPAGPSLDSTT